MNAQVELQQLLVEHGAVLVRQKKHLVYRLPNGRNFVTAKTPDNPDVSARNNVHTLRRILGIVPAKKGDSMPIEERFVVQAAAQPMPGPVVEEARRVTFKERVEAEISRQEEIQEGLLAQAQAHEKRVQMLRAVLPFADEPAIEESLRGVLPAVEAPPVPKPVFAQEPPQQITDRVQVTRQLVLAATQTFQNTFTVNDVMGSLGVTQIRP